MNDVKKNGIIARGVTKVYQLERTRIDVLRGVDVEVLPGETMSIMGASGAGKSTLLHTLGSLDQPTTGDVWFDGENMYQAPARRRNAMRSLEFGFVFQAFHLLPELDVLDNVILPALSQKGALRRQEEIRQRGRELLEAVGLGHRISHRPLEMSGGEQQRASIARALMNRPRYVFADEPTGNLDAVTGQHVLDSLFGLIAQENMGLVIVTHNQDVARRCQSRLLLRDGSIKPCDI